MADVIIAYSYFDDGDLVNHIVSYNHYLDAVKYLKVKGYIRSDTNIYYYDSPKNSGYISAVIYKKGVTKNYLKANCIDDALGLNNYKYSGVHND